MKRSIDTFEETQKNQVQATPYQRYDIYIPSYLSWICISVNTYIVRVSCGTLSMGTCTCFIFTNCCPQTKCRPRPATTGDVTPATSGDGQAATSTSDEYLASIHQRVSDDAIARKVSCNHHTYS